MSVLQRPEEWGTEVVAVGISPLHIGLHVCYRGQKSGERRSWLWGYRPVEGAPLHPLGFALQVDHVSTDVTKWKVTRVVYNGQMFYEIEDLMDRYKVRVQKNLSRVSVGPGFSFLINKPKSDAPWMYLYISIMTCGSDVVYMHIQSMATV